MSKDQDRYAYIAEAISKEADVRFEEEPSFGNKLRAIYAVLWRPALSWAKRCAGSEKGKGIVEKIQRSLNLKIHLIEAGASRPLCGMAAWSEGGRGGS